jgi:hypothetical protein
MWDVPTTAFLQFDPKGIWMEGEGLKVLSHNSFNKCTGV